jgi:plastocyanin
MTSRSICTALALAALAGACGGDGGTTDPMGGTGNIEGQVSAAGTGVGGAAIALQGGGTTTTNQAGAYSFTGVAVGTRQLTLTVPSGFSLAAGQSATRSASVTAGQTSTVSWELTGAGGGDEVRVITLAGVSFTPSQLTIPVGTRVRWVAQDSGHTVTPNNAAQPGAWPSQSLDAGQSYEFTFTTAGTFDYHCVPHQAMGMTGRIVVQ